MECFSDIDFSINGGIETYDQIRTHLENGVVGVMIGRAFVNKPMYWRSVDGLVYGEDVFAQNCSSSLPSTPQKLNTRRQISAEYIKYGVCAEAKLGPQCRRMLVAVSYDSVDFYIQALMFTAASSLMQPTFGLFHVVKGNKTFRSRVIDGIRAYKNNDGVCVDRLIWDNLDKIIMDDVLDADLSVTVDATEVPEGRSVVTSSWPLGPTQLPNVDGLVQAANL
jgi:tRNA-dihydrouridine synthase